MRVVIQKSLSASVSVLEKNISSIESGLVLLVGFCNEDDSNDIDYLVRKVVNLRIFDDENGVMNKSILQSGGEILCVSQFTLYADIKKGNRPSYVNAMSGDKAISLYDEFCDKLSEYVMVKKGVFGADMKVSLVNDGPTTIIIDSKS